MVDDAHGLGVIGNNGGGSLEMYNLDAEDVPILMGTYSITPIQCIILGDSKSAIAASG